MFADAISLVDVYLYQLSFNPHPRTTGLRHLSSLFYHVVVACLKANFCSPLRATKQRRMSPENCSAVRDHREAKHSSAVSMRVDSFRAKCLKSFALRTPKHVMETQHSMRSHKTHEHGEQKEKNNEKPRLQKIFSCSSSITRQ